MKYEILIVGRGGQGVLLLGRILGLAASKYANLYAVVTESYAAETRGGESRSDVIIASSMEEAPYVKVVKPDIVVFMYPYRIETYKSILTPNTIVVLDEEYVNPSLFKEFKVISAKYSEIAEKTLGTRRVANIVILGRILRELTVLNIDHVSKAIEDLISPSWLNLNLKALETGYKL
ncbi:MAG: 2-oxoacid:acceptor oxidoreductase family protein [Desulfurococcaceae archaeon]